MPPELQQGFRLGPWKIEPLRGAVTGPDGQMRHLEPKVMDVFVCLAQHANTLVSRDDLLDTAWHGQDVSDEPLTRAIGELRKALGDDRGSQSFVETVPKRGYRLVGDVTPLLPDSGSASAGALRPRYLLAAALVCAIAIAVTYRYFSYPESPMTPPGDSGTSADSSPALPLSQRSVAVLPFRNRSANEEDAYFVDGIHDDVVTQLAKIEAIDRVISRTTMERYRDTDRPIPEIGRELGVGTILAGGVQRAGDNVRINVQLIDTLNDQYVWAESFDRRTTPGNIFDIQSEIAAAVAAALQVSITVADQQRISTVPTQNLDALENYFRAGDRLARRTTEAIGEAVPYLESAIAADPEFTQAYVTLARALHLKSFYGGISDQSEKSKARALVSRALEIDPRSDAAYAVLGSLEIGSDNAAAEAALKHSLELNPGNSVALQEYCDLLGPWLGRNLEALPICQRAVEIDPLSPIRHVVLGQALSGLGRSDDAEAAFRRSVEIDDEFSYGYANLGLHARSSKGQLHEAVRWFRKSIALDPGSIVIAARLGTAYLDLGEMQQARDWIEFANRRAPQNGETNAGMSYLHAVRGNYSEAAAFARKVLEYELPEFAGYAMSPIRDYEIRQGRIGDARELYASRYPEFLSMDFRISPVTRWPALDLAFVLMQTGEKEQATLILERVLQSIETSPRLSPFWGYEIGDVHAYEMLGDREKALASLEQAFAAGWKAFWRYELKVNLSLASMHDDPRFQSTVARIEDDVAAQLAKLREWEANGELAPVPAEIETEN